MTSTMDWPEYIAQQIKTGVYAENSPFPENDPRVLREFLSLVKDGPAEITVLADRYGYFFDACDVGREGANVVGSSSLIDVNLGVGYADFVKDLPVICEQAAGRIRIITDTFSFADGYGDGNPALEGLHWLNSPVAAINMSWEAYLESLTTERRKKHRRSCADFEKTNLKFALSDQALTTAELDWVQTNLQRKWGDDADYAYRQTLWSHAVGKFRPNQNLTMRVTDADKLVFVQTMVVKGDAVYCQSIAKDEDRFYNGLAAFTDFECIKALCGKGTYAIFDPSCRCSFEDPESIGIAKRATVNKNCLKPLLAIGELPPEIASVVGDAKIHGKEA